MGYTSTEWKSGDVITAEKLNKIESGISACSDDIYVIHLDSEWDESSDPINFSVRETVSEIQEACASGKTPLLSFDGTLFTEALDNFKHVTYGSDNPIDYLVFQSYYLGSSDPHSFWFIIRQFDIDMSNNQIEVTYTQYDDLVS